MIIEGAISVKSAIEAGKRDVFTVYMNAHKMDKNFAYIKRIAQSKGIEVKMVNGEDLLAFVKGKSHGGICAEVGPRKSDVYASGDVFAVDGIEDPFNLGSICRTCYALGVTTLLLPKKNYETMEAQALKSSAGAFDFMNILFCDLEKEVKELKKQGLTIYGLKRNEQAFDAFEVNYPSPSMFILGGEKRGISVPLEALCDAYVYIPYATNFRNSLSGASACDVLSTILFNQRKKS